MYAVAPSASSGATVTTRFRDPRAENSSGSTVPVPACQKPDTSMETDLRPPIRERKLEPKVVTSRSSTSELIVTELESPDRSYPPAQITASVSANVLITRHPRPAPGRLSRRAGRAWAGPHRCDHPRSTP